MIVKYVREIGYSIRRGDGMINSSLDKNQLEVITPNDWVDLEIERLLKEIWQLPKKMIHEIRMAKSVYINGTPARFNETIHFEDRISIDISSFQIEEVPPTLVNLQILYEDEHLLIVNKPAGLPTHGNTPEEKNALTNGVSNLLLDSGKPGRVRHIHRLDKDTTGAVLFAKNNFVGVMLDRMLEERKIKRTYTAIVHGKLNQKSGTINAKIGRDRHHPTRRRVSPTGQDAVTNYEFIYYDAKQNLSQIICKLDTGRTHQIRVHLAHLGHSLAGDVLYGGKPIFNRPALHAKFLEFEHPLTMEFIRVEAPYLDKKPIFFK